MKDFWALLAAVFLVSCGDGPTAPEIQYPDDATVLTVEGMQCSNCRATVMRALSKVEGIEWAQVEPEAGQVAYSGPAERNDVAVAIRDVGYEVVD
jgi:copper chaperone CopZ